MNKITVLFGIKEEELLKDNLPDFNSREYSKDKQNYFTSWINKKLPTFKLSMFQVEGSYLIGIALLEFTENINTFDEKQLALDIERSYHLLFHSLGKKGRVYLISAPETGSGAVETDQAI